MGNRPKPNDTKIIFMGTPGFADVTLQRLIKENYKIVAVFSKPPHKSGRKKILEHSPVAKTAQKHKLELFETFNIRNPEIIQKIEKYAPDLIIVAAYGRILPKAILDVPRFGALNIHASLLPALRGASPIQQALIEGRKETGITIIKMDSGLDTGEVLANMSLPITSNDNSETLSQKLADLGTEHLIEILPSWITGKIIPEAQNDSLATYTAAIKKEAGEIKWHLPAERIDREWRALYGWPGIFTYFRDSGALKRLKIIEMEWSRDAIPGAEPGKIIKYGGRIGVAANPGIVYPAKVQPEGKKILAIEEFARGKPNFLGTVFENYEKSKKSK